MNIKYFDHAATTAVAPEVLHEMIPYFSKNYGNASSMYEIARISKRAMNEARAKIAHAIGASPKEIYFTSCGSESDNLAIKGIAYANKEKGKHIITSKIEHNAVLNSCERLEEQGFEITYLNVDQNGFVNLEELKNAIREDTILITIMFANNEVGTIEPVEKIAEIDIKAYGLEMLKAGTDLGDFTEEQLINLDAKCFEKNGKKCVIAQVNTVSIEEVLKRQNDIENVIMNKMKEENIYLFVFVITDILNSNSEIIALGEKAREVIENAFDKKLENHRAFLEGVVSRKKQLLPNIDKCL